MHFPTLLAYPWGKYFIIILFTRQGHWGLKAKKTSLGSYRYEQSNGTWAKVSESQQLLTQCALLLWQSRSWRKLTHCSGSCLLVKDGLKTSIKPLRSPVVRLCQRELSTAIAVFWSSDTGCLDDNSQRSDLNIAGQTPCQRAPKWLLFSFGLAIIEKASTRERRRILDSSLTCG